jgi:hypothetical protein
LIAEDGVYMNEIENLDEWYPGIVGCYTLDLYCYNSKTFGDHGDMDFPQSFTGPTRQYCDKKARKEGWTINYKTNISLCPKCSGKLNNK